MNSKHIRSQFIEFFKSKGHQQISSASLIPDNDPSVLFTTAGMHPLVPYLMGQAHPRGTRLVNAQKCIRTGDITEVGDATHLTFFEMLGNWSLGDYFKKEAIEWSFEFLTSSQWLGIPIAKLGVSVFAGDSDAERDDESANLWRALGIQKDRIGYLPKANNWWGPAGKTGPCGPDTEMFFWVGEGEPPAGSNPANDEKNWVEIWNDVFMQFNKTESGTFVPLEKKNVDTGMGLERTVAVLSGVKSAYDTDLFAPIFKVIHEIASGRDLRSERIIADHLRAAVFILGDDNGVAPSNTDQGYVLRRLIRRATTFGFKLGVREGLALAVADAVVKDYAPVYGELARNSARIFEELKREEERFLESYDQGLKQLEKIVPQNNTIVGNDVFILFSTYGFPPEMTEEIASERGLAIDWQGYQVALEEHQRLSKMGSEKRFAGGLADHSEISVKYHTTTHLLHRALKNVLGDHVQQRGSNITPERMRFDFCHPDKMSKEQIAEVEAIVNQAIQQALPVQWEVMSVAEAKDSGAIGLFEDKYGETVKVYTMGNFSKEICGGPHVDNTSILGAFKILKEESSSAGVRRIKAVLK
jgi:alanyl-tRNA synthetase